MNALYQHCELFFQITVTNLPCISCTVGFTGNSNNMTRVKAFHLVIETTIAFPLLQDFSTKLWYTVVIVTKCFVAKGYSIIASLYWGNDVIVNLIGLTSRQLLRVRKSDLCYSETVYKPLQFLITPSVLHWAKANLVRSHINFSF